MKKSQQGFTLIELMIVVAIIGILAAIALPAYQTYTKKAKFTEVMMATAPVKLAVDMCYQETEDLLTCVGATRVGGATDLFSRAAAGDLVSSVALSSTDGKITATGEAEVDSETYVITPVTGKGSINWDVDSTSSCLAAGLC